MVEREGMRESRCAANCAKKCVCICLCACVAPSQFTPGIVRIKQFHAASRRGNELSREP